MHEPIDAALAFLAAKAPFLYAGATAFATAWLRVRLNKGSLGEALLEGAFCGALSSAAVPAFGYFGLAPEMAAPVGAFVGVLGYRKLEALADRIVSKRT